MTTTPLRCRAIAMLMVLALLVGGGGAGIAGCGSSSQSKNGTTTTKPARASSFKGGGGTSRLNSNTDPCAMRLHDLCAPLLLFYARYQQLPSKIDELSQVPGVTVPELVCPQSSQPYVYNPHGPSGREPGTRLILYDATPAHAGHRWGIEVREPTPGQALVAKVVVMP
jgi:hypothetical protein